MWEPGQSGNPAGRPIGTREIPRLPIRTQKALLKEIAERAIVQKDSAAQDGLLLLLLRTAT